MCMATRTGHHWHKLYPVSPAVKRTVLARDPMCVWCDTAPATVTDHVMPLSVVATTLPSALVAQVANAPTNLVGACVHCNCQRRALSVESYAQWLEARLPDVDSRSLVRRVLEALRRG